MKIFFDLDGTLFDSKMRLYRLFQHLVPKSSLTFDQYWEYKQNKISHPEILEKVFHYKSEEIDDFQLVWLKLIESKKWLSMDKPFVGLKEFLEDLKLKNQLYIVTARQYEQVAFDQINSHKLENLFNAILVTKQIYSKEFLIKQHNPTETDWLVGDTGNDIKTGKALGMQTAAVLTGFLNKEVLLSYHPDVVVNSIFNLNFNKDEWT